MARQAGGSVVELLLGSLADEFKCCVCLDQIEKPVRLPCAHSMCAGCAQRMLAEYGFCPICKKPATQRAAHPNELLGRLLERFIDVREQVERCYGSDSRAAVVPSQRAEQSAPPPPAAGADAGADAADDFDVPGIERLRQSLRTDATPSPNAPAEISTDELDAELAQTAAVAAQTLARIQRSVNAVRVSSARDARGGTPPPHEGEAPRILMVGTQSPAASSLARGSPSADAKRRRAGAGAGADVARPFVAETQPPPREALDDSPQSEPSEEALDEAAADAFVLAASRAAAAHTAPSAARPPVCARARGTPASAARAPGRPDAEGTPAAAGGRASERQQAARAPAPAPSSSAAPVASEEPEPDDELCCVCGSGESEPDNLIVFCARCDLAVHQVCYALAHVPAGDWLCDRCEQPEALAAAVRCAVCPSTTGAFKRTERGRWGGWIHVVCAQWIPGLGFKRAARLEAAAGVDLLRPDRLRLTCSLCAPKPHVAGTPQPGGGTPLPASAGGAKPSGKARAKPPPAADPEGRTSVCVQCTRGKCLAAFHVTCAQRAGCFMQIREAAGGEDVVHEVFCPKHSKQASPAAILVESTPPSTLPGGGARSGQHSQKKRRSR